MAKYFATNVTQCKKNSVTTTIIVPLVVSITFYYTRAVLSIKHAFSVYVHNIVEDWVPSKYMHIILLSIVKVVSEVQYCMGSHLCPTMACKYSMVQNNSLVDVSVLEQKWTERWSPLTDSIRPVPKPLHNWMSKQYMVSGCWEKGDSNYERVNVTTIASNNCIFYSYVCTPMLAYVLDKNAADSLLYFRYI